MNRLKSIDKQNRRGEARIRNRWWLWVIYWTLGRRTNFILL